jgi:cytochrome c oxidase assembly protein Cox11
MNSTFRLRTTNSHDWNSRREYGTYNDDNERRQRARNMAFGVSAAIVGFVGFAYASVPLYRMFCNMTG